MNLNANISGKINGFDDLNKCCVIIPALNPLPVLLTLVKDLQQHGLENILLIDDGSSTEFQNIFTMASEMGAMVLRHPMNLGKGAALKTAFRHVIAQDFSGVITVDADGQHSAKDAARIACEVLKEKAPVCILGVRSFNSEVPLRSKFGNVLTRQIFHAFSATRVSDTQTGLRGFSIDLLPSLCNVSGQRYEFEMKMLLWLATEKLPIKEICIDTIYIDDNSHSHFNPIIDSLRIYWVLFRDFFVSISSFGLDIAIFSVLYALTDQILLSTYVARFFSGGYNFAGNKIFVFRVSRSNRLGKELIQYIVLAVVVATLSGAMVQVVFQKTFWNIALCKIIIDFILYLFSFLARRFFIFKYK